MVLPGGLGILLLIVPGWLCLWTFVMWCISRFGWSLLARRYPVPSRQTAPGSILGFQSITIRGVNYNNCVWVEVREDGMALRCHPQWLFLFHQPIFLPWNVVEPVSIRQFGPLSYLVVEVPLDSSRSIRIILPMSVLKAAEKLRDAGD